MMTDRSGGVPILRADSPDCAAGLVFRVGRYDEQLRDGGITSLVAHLAARRAGCTAQVDGLFTTFTMTGSDPAGIAAFVAGISRELTADQSAEVAGELGALQQELRARPRATAGPGGALARRYGPAGPGLAGYPEYGLFRLGWNALDAWRRHWLVAGNAVLWIAGPVPAGLRIELPAGPAPVAAPLPPAVAEPPGYYLAPGNVAAGLSLIVPQVPAGSITRLVLTGRLRHRLGPAGRLTAAVTEPVSADQYHCWLAAGAPAGEQARVAGTMVAALEELASAGCSAAEVADQAAVMGSRLQGPAGPGEVLRRSAQRVLTGLPALSAAQQVQLAAAGGGSEVASLAADLLGTLVVSTPRVLAPVRDRMPALDGGPDEPVTGSRYRAAGSSGACLTVGRDGVMAESGTGLRRTVRWADVALLAWWADGPAEVIPAAGQALFIDPRPLARGRRAVQAVAAQVSPELIVRISEPAPHRPPPVAGAAARRATWLQYLRASWLVAGALIGVTAFGRPLGGGPSR